jgi:hypothetical protein
LLWSGDLPVSFHSGNGDKPLLQLDGVSGALMMSYTRFWDAMLGKVSDNSIQRDADRAFIPFDPANVSYQKYLKWLDEGNTPAPYTPPATTLPATPSIEDRIDDHERRITALEQIIIGER